MRESRTSNFSSRNVSIWIYIVISKLCSMMWRMDTVYVQFFGLREETQMIRSLVELGWVGCYGSVPCGRGLAGRNMAPSKKKTFYLVSALALALIVFLFLFLICQSDRQFDPTYTNRNIVDGCLLGTFLLLLTDWLAWQPKDHVRLERWL